jgi:hypothetical protein
MMVVILNEVKNVIISTEPFIEILRLTPQNNITTQSVQVERRPVLNGVEGCGWG